MWRALGGATQIELDAVAYVHEMDRSAVFLDARDAEQFREATLSRAVNVPASLLEREKDVGEVHRAKDDGRRGFHNVAFYGGTFESLSQRVK